MEKQFFIDNSFVIKDINSNNLTYSQWLEIKEKVTQQYFIGKELTYTPDWINNKIKSIISQSRPGYVYLLKEGNYKIGRTKNIKQRLSNLQTARNVEIQIVAYKNFEDCVKVESLFKNLYESRLERGEWYYLSEKEVEVLKQVLDS